MSLDYCFDIRIAYGCVSLFFGKQLIAPTQSIYKSDTGDDPRWADPNFDDSQWELLESDKSSSEQD